MSGLGSSLKWISGDSITFMTIPWKAAPSTRDRVVWTDAVAGAWANLAADPPINAKTPASPAATTATPATTAPGATTPSPTIAKKVGREALSVDDAIAVRVA